MAAIALALLILAPLALQSEYVLRIAGLVLVWAIAGTGWNLIAGYAGQVSFGHAAYFGIGAYTSALLFARLGVSPWVALVVGPALAALVGVLVSVPALRLRGPYFALSTLAFQLMLLPIFIYFVPITGGSTGMTLPFRDDIRYLEFSGRLPYYVLYLVLAALVFAGVIWLERSRLGRFFVAIREDEDAAASLGVDVHRYKLLAMALSCAITAAGGVLYVQFIYFIDPLSAFGFGPLLQMILVSIVGGVGTALGPLVGSIVLVPLAELLALFIGHTIPGLHQAIFGGLLMLVVIALPRGLGGLVGRRR